MMRAAVYLPCGTPPGPIGEVALAVTDLDDAVVRTDAVTVMDESGVALLRSSDLRFDPAAGGGPLAGPASDRSARAFALVNTAFHAHRALRFAAHLLERPLPHLTIRIGMHLDHGGWGGGHYRLPALNYSELPETDPVAPSGEIHLGYGKRFLDHPTPRYFHAPGHNAGLIYHEVGHHICRHTADFRLNHLLPPQQQTNRKIALDEGTCDYLAATLLNTADIFGWHRAHVPAWQATRRCLGERWTMAHFHGGRRRDPHADGTIWASALWSARNRVIAAGHRAERFDRMLLGGLEAFGSLDGDIRDEAVLRRRRHFSRLLAGMVDRDPALADPVLTAMAVHGIAPGMSNAALRDRTREPWLARSYA